MSKILFYPKKRLSRFWNTAHHHWWASLFLVKSEEKLKRLCLSLSIFITNILKKMVLVHAKVTNMKPTCSNMAVKVVQMVFSSLVCGCQGILDVENHLGWWLTSTSQKSLHSSPWLLLCKSMQFCCQVCLPNIYLLISWLRHVSLDLSGYVNKVVMVRDKTKWSWSYIKEYEIYLRDRYMYIKSFKKNIQNTKIKTNSSSPSEIEHANFR